MTSPRQNRRSPRRTTLGGGTLRTASHFPDHVPIGPPNSSVKEGRGIDVGRKTPKAQTEEECQGDRSRQTNTSPLALLGRRGGRTLRTRPGKSTSELGGDAGPNPFPLNDWDHNTADFPGRRKEKSTVGEKRKGSLERRNRYSRKMSRDMSSTPPQKGGVPAPSPPSGRSGGGRHPPPPPGPYHHHPTHPMGHPSPPHQGGYAPPPGRHPTSYQYPGSAASPTGHVHHHGHPSPPSWGHPHRAQHPPQPPPGYVLVPIGQPSPGSGGVKAGPPHHPAAPAAVTPEGNGMNATPPSHGHGGYHPGGAGYGGHHGYHPGYYGGGGGTPPPGGHGKMSPPRTYMEGESGSCASRREGEDYPSRERSRPEGSIDSRRLSTERPSETFSPSSFAFLTSPFPSSLTRSPAAA